MATNKLLQLIKSPIKFRLFLLAKLPSAFFSGVRIKYADEEKCITIVPYKWFSQNPFKSTYFACLAMAAETSTGILSMLHIYKRKPSVSMLVINLQANFVKKATGITAFTCNDGLLIKQAIEKAISTGQSQTLTATSTGVNKYNEVVAIFHITWSFKAKAA